MDINCLPLLKPDGQSYGNLDHGFHCITTGGFSANSLTLTSIDGNPISYVENYWTDGELIISLLLFILVMFEIIKFGFEFFFPKIIGIKRQ
jgi:hypothetical protein